MAIWYYICSSTTPSPMLGLVINIELYSAFSCFVHDTHCHTHMACLDPLGMLGPVSFSSPQHHMPGQKWHVNTHKWIYSWRPVYFTQVQLENHSYFCLAARSTPHFLHQALSKSSYTALITPSTQLSQHLFYTLPANYVGCERS